MSKSTVILLTDLPDVTVDTTDLAIAAFVAMMSIMFMKFTHCIIKEYYNSRPKLTVFIITTSGAFLGSLIYAIGSAI